MQNLSSIVVPPIIPDPVEAQILTKIGELETLLAPYGRSLTDPERRQIPKMGADSVSFVQNALNAIAYSLGFMSRDFDPDEFKNAFGLSQQLDPIGLRLNALARSVEDGEMTFGSIAYTDGLEVYTEIGPASKKDSGLLPFYNAMKVRFDKLRGKHTPDTPPTP